MEEETITEQNLLEIRRRHWPQTHVKTFPRREEARNGADWEWHLIGRSYTFKMRVQAKRVQQDDRLRIKYRVRSSGKQQRELLVHEADAVGMSRFTVSIAPRLSVSSREMRCHSIVWSGINPVSYW